MRSEHGESVAFRKIDSPEGYTMFSWEILFDESVLYRFAFETTKEGQDQRTWDESRERAVCVTKQEIVAEYHAYEKRTGNCGNCMGEGKVFASWSASDGTKYKTCDKCGGSGFAGGQNSLFGGK